jgi:Rrf2 family protein
MQITRQTEYAIKTLSELGKLPYGQLLSSKVISQRHEIPEEFLHKTIQILSKAGLVATQRGVQGGVRLNRPLKDITIADVMEAMEGPIALNVCLNPGFECRNKSTCEVHKILGSAQQAMLDELKRKSLADIVAAGQEGRI